MHDVVDAMAVPSLQVPPLTETPVPLALIEDGVREAVPVLVTVTVRLEVWPGVTLGNAPLEKVNGPARAGAPQGTAITLLPP